MESRQVLENGFSWIADKSLPESTIKVLLEASYLLTIWLSDAGKSTNNPAKNLIETLGTIHWKPSPRIWRMLGFHHVELSTVFIDPAATTVDIVVHEFAHVLDNCLGDHPLASILGGGPSDDLARFVGYEPDRFFPRFRSPHFEQILLNSGLEINPTDYGRSCGPAEDFAESFRLAVTDSEHLSKAAPLRFTWFEKWRKSLSSQRPLLH